MSTSNWIWSQQYGDYYCVTYNEFREYYHVLIKLEAHRIPLIQTEQPVYHWAKQQAQAETPEVPPRRDSGNQYDGSNVAQMPEPGVNSRIRFGKTYPIEQNVKVKDIGHIHPSHVGKLLQYWKDED
ncbi:hypothetical protein J4E91_008143 [Alternaria rosae]|nr:hypothetical protein J4E91_008143 [Alternaria rosae]